MAIPKPSANIPIPRPFCGTKIITVKLAGKITGRLAGSAAVLLIFASVAAAQGPRKPRPVPSTAPPAAENPPAAPAAKKPAPAAAAKPASAAKPKTAPASAASPKQLEELSRALKKKNPAAAYEKLSVFANQNSANVSGTRAALALGYYDYSKTNFGLASKWLVRAQSDPLLREYALYWSAATNIALNKQGDAITQLQSLRSDFPDSVMTEQALESLAGAAIALDQPDTALAALDAYAPTNDKPALLLLRGEARERAGRALEAVADYQSLYLRFPTAEQGRQAGAKLDFLRSTLKSGYIEIPLAQRFAHAGALFAGKLWSEARNEYSQLLPQLSGADKERAELRIMECGVSLGAGVSAIAALQVTDADVDAERFFALAQYYRSTLAGFQYARGRRIRFHARPAKPLGRTGSLPRGQLLLGAARSRPRLQLLQACRGKFSRCRRFRPFAMARRVDGGSEAPARRCESARRTSASFSRLAIHAGCALLARPSRRRSGQSRRSRAATTQNCRSLSAELFSGARLARAQPCAGQRRRQKIRRAGPSRLFRRYPNSSDTIPPAAATRQARADALRSIALRRFCRTRTASCIRRHRRAASAARSRAAAIAAGHFGAASSRSANSSRSSNRSPFRTVPHDVWRVAYALPFEASIQPLVGASGLDPMLVAGLIRQESAFDPEAHSGANAIGLMQLLPKTARRLAQPVKNSIFARTAHRSRLQRPSRHDSTRRICETDLEVWNRRWPRTMPEKTAWRIGRGPELPRDRGVRRLDSVHRDAPVRRKS